MKKKSKYGRNPKLNPKTHCVMVRFDDEEWNKFLTMYEESEVYAKAVFLKAHFFGQKFKVLKVDTCSVCVCVYLLISHQWGKLQHLFLFLLAHDTQPASRFWL